MKQLLTTLILIMLAFASQAQMTGSFNDPIIFNSSSHDVEYYVPSSYNSANQYPLIVALHGCGPNTATAYRDNFISLADSIGAILVCPDYNGSQITGAAGQIIPNVIDSTMNQLGYNIDTNAVYLTGFSCNGQATVRQAWNDVYSFRGIIPLNAWFPAINHSDYNYLSKTPTCFCSGTADFSYSNNELLYDSLVANGGTGKFVSMPGIPHTFSFPTRDAEMMKCFRWFDSVAAPLAVYELNNKKYQIDIFPNPAGRYINIKVSGTNQEQISARLYDLYGKTVLAPQAFQKEVEQMSTTGLTPGIYILELRNELNIISRHKLMIQSF